MPKSNTSAFGVNYIPVEKHGIETYWYNCYSCGESGPLVKLIAHLQNCNLKKAAKLLRKNVIQQQVTINGLQSLMDAIKTSQVQKDSIYKVSMPIRANDQHMLLKYLEKRKKDAHDVLNIGYIINKYKLYYCAEGRFAGRIVMPIRDVDGSILDFNDRATFDTKRKSLHRKGSKINDLLYGFYENGEKEKVVICEGAFDMFQIESAIRKKKEFKNYGVIALMGTTLTERRYEVLTSAFSEIVIMFDHEREAVKKSYKVLRQLQEETSVRNATTNIFADKDPGICTGREIIKAIKAGKGTGTYLDHLKKILGV